ncbi:MAG: phenylalanine--tRNA ligase subunit beta [Methanothrix sp.]
MATITFAKNDLVKESGIEKPEVTIPKIGMEVERDADGEITVDITPNRSDLLDIVGLARQLALHEGVRKPRSYEISGDSGISIKVGKLVNKIRPNIAGIVVKDVSFTEASLKYLIGFSEKIGSTLGRNRKKLAMGIHDLSAIEGNLVYDASYEGSITPLGESTDMGFEEVMKRNQKGIVYANTIAAKMGSRQLYPFLRDSLKTISLIPITNSEKTRVTAKTKSLFIDFTGTDSDTISKVADMFACRFVDSGAKVYSVKVVFENGTHTDYPKLEKRSIKIRASGFNEVLGYKIDGVDIKKLAIRSGYMVSEDAKNSVYVAVPPYRYDVLNDQDVYEDLVFAYGYDSIRSRPVPSVNAGSETPFSLFSDKLTEIMLGLGYMEAYNNYLTNEKTEFEMMGREPEMKSTVNIKYSKTENISIMRRSILPSLVNNLKDSASEQMPYKIFEIGDTFSVKDGKARESKAFAFVSEHAKADFAEAKSIIISAMASLGIEAGFEEGSSPEFIPGRCAKITLKSKEIGIIGELHPKILESFGIEEPVVGCEIELSEIMY